MVTQLVCHSFTWGPSGLSEGHTGRQEFKAFSRVFTKCGTCPSFSALDSTMTLSLLSLVSLIRPSCALGLPCLQEPGSSGAHPLQISAHSISSLHLGPAKHITKCCAPAMDWYRLGALRWSLVPSSEATALSSVRIFQVCGWTGLT